MSVRPALVALDRALLVLERSLSRVMLAAAGACTGGGESLRRCF
jgi:hypothetical protein